MPASRGRPHGLLATTRASHTELTQAYTDVSGLAHKSFSGKLGVSLEVLASGVDLYMLRMSITGANPAVQLLQLARKPVLEVLKALKAQDPQEDGIEAMSRCCIGGSKQESGHGISAHAVRIISQLFELMY